MPSVRSLPFALGIIRCRTGRGSNRRALRSSRSRRRNASSPTTMERGVTPSTPAERAPRLPRTRSHATVRKAGSATRLNRSQNRRSGPSAAHRCSLVWIPSTLALASSSVGQGASVFTGDLLACQLRHCELAGSLRHVAGFPGLGLLRTLRPNPGPSADDEPARRPAGCWPGRANPGRFPRSPCPGRSDRRPALPLQPRHRVRRRPSPMASPPASMTGFGVAFLVRVGRRALLPGPHPPGWSRFHT
jgi:hypothetical protein